MGGVREGDVPGRLEKNLMVELENVFFQVARDRIDFGIWLLFFIVYSYV